MPALVGRGTRGHAGAAMGRARPAGQVIPVRTGTGGRAGRWHSPLRNMFWPREEIPVL